MSTSLRQIEAFVMVAKLGSFTQAASQLHISQPGLSLMVRELEAHLKGQLFDRSQRAVRLTAAGEAFLPSARLIADEFQRATAQLRESNAQSARRLNVASTPLFSSALMPTIYQRFRTSYPNAEMRLSVLSRDEVGESVRCGESDCGVGIFSDGMPQLRSEPLFKFGFILLSAAAQAWDGGRRNARLPGIDWSALPEVSYVELPPSGRLQAVINSRKTDAGLELRPPSQILNHLETIIGMTAAGAGPSVLPSFALLGCDGFRVDVRRIRDPHPPQDFQLITAQGREEPVALAGFLESVRALLDEQTLS